MLELGLQDFENYVSSIQNTVTNFIATRPIMDLCLVAERRPGPRIFSGGGIRNEWMWKRFGWRLSRRNGCRWRRIRTGQRRRRRHIQSVGGIT